MSNAPKFINLDLVLKSSTDLGPLAHAFEQDARVDIIAHHEYAGEFTLIAELVAHIDGLDAATLTQHFLAVIAGLPQEAIELWKSATTRRFDYGFESGEQRPACEVAVPATTLVHIGGLGAEIAVTVYPFDPS